MREAVSDRALGGGVSQSELEREWRTFAEEIALPPYLPNVLIEGFECDCVWPAQRVIVELDGRAVHLTVERYESDRRKDRKLKVAGWEPIRVTPRMLIVERSELTADLHRLLG